MGMHKNQKSVWSELLCSQKTNWIKQNQPVKTNWIAPVWVGVKDYMLEFLTKKMENCGFLFLFNGLFCITFLLLSTKRILY